MVGHGAWARRVAGSRSFGQSISREGCVVKEGQIGSWPLANCGVTSAPYRFQIMPSKVVDVPRSGNQVVDALETKRVRTSKVHLKRSFQY